MIHHNDLEIYNNGKELEITDRMEPVESQQIIGIEARTALKRTQNVLIVFVLITEH